MVEAVRRYGRVFSGGSQRVLGDYGDWPRLLWGGAIGQIREVFVDCGGPSGDCYLPNRSRSRPASIGTCGLARLPGGHSTKC